MTRIRMSDRPAAEGPPSDGRAFIAPPRQMPAVLRLGLRLARRRTGSDLLPVALLTWSPRAAVGAAVLESLATRPVGRIDARVLKLVRLTVSFTVGCPFCVGLNTAGWESLLSPEELAVTQGLRTGTDVATLTPPELLAIEFARRTSQTSPTPSAALGEQLRGAFSEREIVVLAATCAQVNYWARLVQGMGCDLAD